jgi:hypothetical protein
MELSIDPNIAILLFLAIACYLMYLRSVHQTKQAEDAKRKAAEAAKWAQFGPAETPDDQRVFTAEELKSTYGPKGKRIYLGCKGVVFDVTQPDYGYPMLTGRDSSIALATMDLVRLLLFKSSFISVGHIGRLHGSDC